MATHIEKVIWNSVALAFLLFGILLTVPILHLLIYRFAPGKKKASSRKEMQ
jgi:hypothetical protein